MTISEQTISIIKDSVSPVQAIEYYTHQQAQHGKYLCPFHNDTHASLSVKGFRWRCWSCGAGGDVIDFVQQLQGGGFREAVQTLAADFNLAVDVRQPMTAEDRRRVNEARILNEIDRKNKRETAAYIDAEIERLTIAHRVLLQHGAPKGLLDKYANEIDALIAERG